VTPLAVLPSSLRRQLEVAVLAGRRAAEAASRGALEGLGVFEDRRPDHLSDEQAAMRRGLRAKWRQLGGDRELLVGECAYEQWHRLLFARFLAENGLLLHPQYQAPVTLEDCQELAGELGEPDGWSVAARFAAEILPGIFRLDDPCFRLRLTPEGRDALEQVVAGLPAGVFIARDALGWVYQFWQKDKKDEVNASERKIGGADLGPVTQLFTENYMVRFLLENSLGAWWASRHSDSPLVSTFEYLRFAEDGKPAAGSFDGWPERVAEVTLMDPCCGSGHFLVEAFSMLWQMRVEEEGLTAVDAQDAVLRDNLFGLELDPRCVQIAMFAVALQAWKSGGGWRQLPVPNIACSGIPVKALVEEWKKLAGGDQRLENALERLHLLFRDADTLGSLIDPRRISEGIGGSQHSLEHVDWTTMRPLLNHALDAEDIAPSAALLGLRAADVALAADFLSREYALLATNVPYLSRAKQLGTLRDTLEREFPEGAGDLATAFLQRSVAMARSIAVVTPENWMLIGRYRELRRVAFSDWPPIIVAQLGVGAFSTAMYDFHVALLIASTWRDRLYTTFIDVAGDRDISSKAAKLATSDLDIASIDALRASPDSRIARPLAGGPLLSKFAQGLGGITTSDSDRFRRFFWELPRISRGWERQQASPRRATVPFGGRERVLYWEGGCGQLVALADEGPATIAGRGAWGRRGVAVGYTGALNATLYGGEVFENVCAVIVPNNPDDLSAIWAFVSSDEFFKSVRQIDKKTGVTCNTLVKVPFDVERWRRVAEEAGPLPEPWSDDPTQWLFHSRPEVSTAPLQVAAARMLGYRWPEQSPDELDGLVDADGIVCLPSVAGEPPATDRLQQILAIAFGEHWSPAKLTKLLEQAGSRKKNLADWIRDDFFKQHCALFGNRPFIWHVWDGQREGFAALVNYHRLDRKALQKLTYTYLGQDWVERQRAAVRDEVAGAEARLAAALELQRKLELILAGEAPYDIYVRWKELHEQPVGWEPDLNDGVRLNIRPFVEAGVLRGPFNIHWKKDRGKNPDGSERHNDIHLPLVQKLAARAETRRT
jgi:hypothetical protein